MVSVAAFGLLHAEDFHPLFLNTVLYTTILVIPKVYDLSRYVTVSAKIPEDLKRRAKELNINISQLIRKAIEREVRLREEKRLRMMAKEASDVLRKIPSIEIVRAIRETREQR